MKKILFYTLLFLVQGCATLANTSEQSITIKTTNNQHYSSTKCNVDNEEGSWVTGPDSELNINRDGNPLKISCKNKYQAGFLSLQPEFQDKYIPWNIFMDLCTVTCLVDGINNAFYEYPFVVSVKMKNRILMQ